jgi:hypothetical protein
MGLLYDYHVLLNLEFVKDACGYVKLPLLHCHCRKKIEKYHCYH